MLNRILIWVGMLSLCAVAAGAGGRNKPQPAVATTQNSACGFAVGKNLLITSAAAVEGAREIIVETTEGISYKGTVVILDSAGGLALLRTEGGRLSFSRLADVFGGGDVQCIGLPNQDIFQPIPQSIPGTSTKPAEKWTVDLQSAPRLPGAPLVVNDDVVGVTLAVDAGQHHGIPAATLAQIRALMENQKSDTGRPGAPSDAIVRIICTKPVAATNSPK